VNERDRVAPVDRNGIKDALLHPPRLPSSTSPPSNIFMIIIGFEKIDSIVFSFERFQHVGSREGTRESRWREQLLPQRVHSSTLAPRTVPRQVPARDRPRGRSFSRPSAAGQARSRAELRILCTSRIIPTSGLHSCSQRFLCSILYSFLNPFILSFLFFFFLFFYFFLGYIRAVPVLSHICTASQCSSRVPQRAVLVRRALPDWKNCSPLLPTSWIALFSWRSHRCCVG
jgi:hypothetical protein